MNLKTAMLLAAGRGERLIPLTNSTPKPLLPVHGKPLIAHHLQRLQQLGIEKVVINVSYLAKKIMGQLGDGSSFNLQIEYSYEEKPLGAGGGLRQALPLLGNEPFIFISSDIYTDFNLAKFFAADWSLAGNLLHLVVTDKAANQRGDFDLINGMIVASDDPRYIYGSIAVIDPAAFQQQSLGFSTLMPSFLKAANAQQASGEYYANILNINTLEEYQSLGASDAR